MSKFPLERSAKFYIAGHRGMVGSAIWREAAKQGFTNLVGKSVSDAKNDLKDLGFTNVDSTVDSSSTAKAK
jgi:GDP-L-fucose synthase